MPSYPLPTDTVRALQALPRGAGVANLSLYLNRYVEYEHGRDGYELNTEAKKYTYANLDYFASGPGKSLLDACVSRHRQMLADAKATTDIAHPATHCIVGLGARSAREVGITLHHLYGFPIIPGSGLKGLARARALLAVFDKLAGKVPIRDKDKGVLWHLEDDIESYQHADINPKRKPHLSYLDSLYGSAEDKEKPESWRERMLVWQFRHIFGVQDRSGDAIFFDAIPQTLPASDRNGLEVDIMNPHYPNYYSKQGQNAPPADYESPIPIYFLTVGKGSSFIFGVASRNGNDKATETAWKWLRAGLETMGVGAKTTSGYGLFKF